MQKAPIIYIGGSKGGVGKSKLCYALIDYLVSHQKPLLVIETDTSNPDVFKTHSPHENKNIISKQVDLDNANGWIDLVNLADENQEHFIVINSAARSNSGINKYSGTLKETLPDLERELLVFWLINRQRDSIELLRIFMNVFPKQKIFVCKNLHFGEQDKFVLYDTSQTKNMIENDGGMTLNFPELADRVADKLYSERIPIFKGLEDFPLGDRAELKRWNLECIKMFDQANIFNNN